jgi:hypothetical protein
VSRNFNEVLKTICLLVVDIIKQQDSEFLNTPREIAMNPRFMPHFKVSQMLFIITNDKKNLFKILLVVIYDMLVNVVFCRIV